MIAVRPEQVGDAPAIHTVNAASFPTNAEADLVDLLRDGGRLVVSLVAIDSGAIVGHVAFSPVEVEHGSGGIGLAPLAVLASHRRCGIGAQLVRDGIDACRVAGYRWIVVLGDPAYYGRFGFQPASSVGLGDEYGGGSAFQVLELVPAALSGVHGLVRYAPEFASVG
jgi:putative acetyltransferase